MVEMYRYLKAVKVNSSEVVLSKTIERLFYFDVFFYLLIVFLLVIETLSYNKHGLFEFVFWVLLLCTVITVNVNKHKFLSKTIIFKRKEGVVCLNKVFPKKDYVFKFSEIEIEKRSLYNENKTGGYLVSQNKYFLKVNGTGEEILLGVTGKDGCFKTFITNYMNSEKKTLENLKNYSIKDDKGFNNDMLSYYKKYI